jgi:hypothetical protein
VVSPGGKKRAITPGDIKWRLLKHAKEALAPVRKEFGNSSYADEKRAIKEFFCQYVNTGEHCATKALGISPLGGTKKNGKSFKMRWSIAGGGKSGGIRLALVAYCAERIVVVAGGWVRKDDPATAEFDAVLKGL